MHGKHAEPRNPWNRDDGHGSVGAQVRLLEGTSQEILAVEGGCNARPLAPGYASLGVSDLTGCCHDRYRWNGRTFEKSWGGSGLLRVTLQTRRAVSD
mgnify:CR=1 FL=1